MNISQGLPFVLNEKKMITSSCKKYGQIITGTKKTK